MQNNILPMFCFSAHYKTLGIAGSSLSAVTKADAGQKFSSKHLTPNILYVMLAVVI
jgi:hypothetical protein